MKFEFLKYPINPSSKFPDKKSSLVPVIPVGLFNKSDLSKFIYFKAMIDSGAGYSIFPAALGEAIGLNIENEYKIPIQGIEKSVFDAFIHDIILEVGGWKFSTYACFSDAETVFPVLGREGFFDLFNVTLNYSKAEIELKHVVKPFKVDFH